MAIVKWNPWHEIEAAQRRMRTMLDLPFASMTLPSADVYETDTEWVAELEVPGFVEKDLTVELVGDTVRVAGQREESKEQKEKAFHMKERLQSSFERRFLLPAGADADAISATFDKGVLKLQAPRSREGGTPAKSISIGT
jgi:HSP20 family protein